MSFPLKSLGRKVPNENVIPPSWDNSHFWEAGPSSPPWNLAVQKFIQDGGRLAIPKPCKIYGRNICRLIRSGHSSVIQKKEGKSRKIINLPGLSTVGRKRGNADQSPTGIPLLHSNKEHVRWWGHSSRQNDPDPPTTPSPALVKISPPTKSDWRVFVSVRDPISRSDCTDMSFPGAHRGFDGTPVNWLELVCFPESQAAYYMLHTLIEANWKMQAFSTLLTSFRIFFLPNGDSLRAQS